jgi:NAD(P)H-flavin reductase
VTVLALAEQAPPTPAAVADLRFATVRRVVPETPDTATYWLTLLDPGARAAYRFRPGQFNMLSIFGAGEVAISISSDPGHPARLAHTVRSTGRVTNLFPRLQPGDQVGVRGPFGRGWPVDEAAGGDLLIMAGGLGLAPLRPAIYEAMRRRDEFGRVVVLVGARTAEHLLYRGELDAWGDTMRGRGLEVGLTVDVADDAWPYGHGVVTTLLEPAAMDPGRTTAFICGPEIMMRFAVRALIERWIPASRIHLSMERNMQCGVGVCGHCQLGPLFVCCHGPVFRYEDVAELMEVPDL